MESPAAAVASAWIFVKSNEKYRDFGFETPMSESPFSSGFIAATSAGSNGEKSLDSKEFQIFQFSPTEGKLP